MKECVKENLNIFPLPGPSAITAADLNKWFFRKIFFLWIPFPEKEKLIKIDLEILSKLDCSLVFFISPKNK